MSESDTDKRANEPSAGLRGGHWTPVADADADLIANCQTPQDFALAMSTWYVLLREASYRRSLTFTLGNGLLAKRIGASIKTTVKACRLLSSLGLLKSTAYRSPSSKLNFPCERTISPAVYPWRESQKPESVEIAERCAIFTQRCETHRPSKLPRILQTSLEKRGLSKKGRSTTIPAALRAEGAGGVRSAPSVTPNPLPSCAVPVAADHQPYAQTGPRVVVERGRKPSCGGHQGVRFRKFSDGTEELDWLNNNFFGEESIP